MASPTWGSLVILLVALVLQCPLCAQGSVCPPPDLIAPCKCADYFKMIDCEKVSADTDLSSIFARLNDELERRNVRPVYDQLKLKETHLTDLGSKGDVLSGVSFRKIHIQRNEKLRRIAPNAFRSSFNTTIELVLEDNEKLGTSKEDNVDLFVAINRFSQLQMVRISDSGIRFVPDKAFSDRPQPALRKILLTDCRLERVGDNAFTGLDGLELLNLDGNQISQLSVRSLEITSTRHSPGRLQLFLRSNKLSPTSFPAGIFSRLRREVYLNLDLNNMTRVPKRTFQGLFLRGSVLSLKKNPLRCDCDFKWLFDQNLLYNSSNPKKDFQLRDYQCISERDEEQVINEVDAGDFVHCTGDRSAAARHCLDQASDPESEDECLSSHSAHTQASLGQVLLMHALLCIVFRYFLCQ